MSQAQSFLGGEGDQWHQRNRESPMNPSILAALEVLSPKKVLEIGCGTGRYLEALRGHWGADCTGIDPSADAIMYGRHLYPRLTLKQGTAEDMSLEYMNHRHYDLVIFGFCLYLLDRSDLFWTVAYADAILNAGGHIAIHDFHPGEEPRVVPYHHRPGLYSYKMDYSSLWLANPAYRLVSTSTTNEKEGSAITIIKKGTWRERFDHGSG